MDALTLVGGAMGAFLIGATLFQPVRASTRQEQLLGWSAKVVAVATSIGWLMMWFTEEAIWSDAPRTCTELATIELKGQVYRNCAYLIHRYQAGEWLFFMGIVVIAIGSLLQRPTKQKA